LTQATDLARAWVAHSRASRQGVCECTRVRRDDRTGPIRPTMLAEPNLLNRA